MDCPIYKNALDNCKNDQQPIFFCNVDFTISDKKKFIKHRVDKIVVKGNIDQIKKNRGIKISIIQRLLKDDNQARKKSYSFDLSRINIVSINIHHFMGYGTNENV